MKFLAVGIICVFCCSRQRMPQEPTFRAESNVVMVPTSGS